MDQTLLDPPEGTVPPRPAPTPSPMPPPSTPESQVTDKAPSTPKQVDQGKSINLMYVYVVSLIDYKYCHYFHITCSIKVNLHWRILKTVVIANISILKFLLVVIGF